MERNKEINHWCVLCGTGYHACDSCNKEKHFTPWRTLTDTIEHYKIFTILKDYNNKLINREQAKELLSGLDLTGKDNYKASAKKVLEDICTDDVVDVPTLVDTELVPKRKSRKSIKAETDAEIENETVTETISSSVD